MHTEDPEEFARTVRAEVLATSRLHSSVGIGDNKLRAKIATSFGKPQGMFRLTADNWFEVMGEKGTRELWGIGSETSRKLAALGLNTVAELAAAADEDLASAFGPTMGPRFGRIGRDIDLSPVSAQPWVARSHSREITFQQNLTDWDAVAEEVRRLSVRVLADIVAENRPVVRVVLKVRYAPFFTRTAAKLLPQATFDADVIADAAVALAERFDHTREVRLLGVRLEMTSGDEVSGRDRSRS